MFWNGNESLETTFKAIQERQKEQERTIADLRDRLARTEDEITELRPANAKDTSVAIPEHVPHVGRSSSVLDNLEEHIAVYEFDQSMWDATLLLALTDIGFMDRLIICVGVVLNIGLQFGLLIIIKEDMLINPYDEGTVQEMVKWRVNQGHSQENFDASTGESLVSKLCGQKLWSFEQEQYNEMHAYLFKDHMPGVLLSILALILWVLTVVVEYRRVVEQALAIVTLPACGTEPEAGFRRDINGEYEVTGIRPYLRILTLIVLCLPRLGVQVMLCYFGCQYLARTPTLEDIVLNAVALAFVLDVDELLANVLLTQKTRTLLKRIQPLPCAHKAAVCCSMSLKDLFRYALTVAMVAVSIFVWVLPFKDNVEAAAFALCGGRYSFSYSGGSAAEPKIVMQSAAEKEWVPECSGDVFFSFLDSYYLKNFNHSKRTTTSNTTQVVSSAQDYAAKRVKAIVSYAFQSGGAGSVCGPGEVRSPRGTCGAAPSALLEALPEIGGAELAVPSSIPACPKFNPLGYPHLSGQSLLNAACANPTQGECQWTWLAYSCEHEQPPPGATYTAACSTDIMTACQEWEHWELEHPTFNCFHYEVCRDQPGNNCGLVVRGELWVYLNNETVFVSDQSRAQAGVEYALFTALNYTESADIVVKSLHARRLDHIDAYSTGYAEINYQLWNVPHTLKMNAILGSSAEIQSSLNAYFYNETGTNASTDPGLSSLVQLDVTDYVSTKQQEHEDREALIALHQAERLAQLAQQQEQQQQPPPPS